MKRLKNNYRAHMYWIEMVAEPMLIELIANNWTTQNHSVARALRRMEIKKTEYETLALEVICCFWHVKEDKFYWHLNGSPARTGRKVLLLFHPPSLCRPYVFKFWFCHCCSMAGSVIYDSIWSPAIANDCCGSLTIAEVKHFVSQ